MVLYQIIKSEIKVEDTIVDTYGIACIEDEKLVTCVNDISPDKDFVQSTVNKFNQNKLSKQHFIDAIEDAII